jgi:4-hydroxy-2-oxoheptanedioate aldolase
MAEIGRLNNIIRAWEEGRTAVASFAHTDRQTAIQFSTAPYDGVLFEMEHHPWDMQALEESLQFMLNRRQIVTSGSFAPTVTPMVRIPANGVEMTQSFAKQALDRGVYGVGFPHIGSAEQAYNAVAACRYARKIGAENFEPAGARGDGPFSACRYWGLTLQEYYAKADVWPLDPNGEIVVILMIESVHGVNNLEEILKVPGIGCILIGEGDLSQALGYPRQTEHPVVKEAIDHIVATCKKHGVRVGHPNVNSANVEKIVAAGYDFILSGPVPTYDAVKRVREIGAK